MQIERIGFSKIRIRMRKQGESKSVGKDGMQILYQVMEYINEG